MIAAFVEAAAVEGLNVALPLDPRRAAEILPWARGGLLLLSGGVAFFENFSKEPPSGEDHPLDAFTARIVQRLARPLREAGMRVEIRHPFANGTEPMPFQELGRATGRLSTSRLGLDLHPRYGSHLAYRALLLFDREVEVEATAAESFDPCADCEAPCIPACPAVALAEGRLDPARCFSLRLAEDPCADGCRSRLACPQGSEHAGTLASRRFHQAASLAFARSLLS